MNKFKGNKFISILVISLLLITAIPITTFASNDLYSDMVVLLKDYGNKLSGANGLILIPTGPTQELGYMQAEWGDKYKKVHEEWGDYWVKDGETISHLYAITKSNYAPPRSTLSWRTVAYKYDLPYSSNPSDLYDKNRVKYTTDWIDYLSLQQEWVSLVHRTDAYKNGNYLMYDKMTVPASTLHRGIPQDELDEADILIQVAKVQIYNPQTGEVFDEFVVDLRDTTVLQQIGAKHGMQGETGFWQSRSQIIQLKSKQDKHGPDFIVTGKNAYEGDPGDTAKVEVELINAGDKQTTDFGAMRDGGNWGNPKVDGKGKLLIYDNEITLSQKQTKKYTLDVTIPELGEVTTIEFRANIDGYTPNNEMTLENNSLIVNVKATGTDVRAAQLGVSEKRITKAYNLTDIGNLITFNFTYGSTGYHSYTCGAKDCSGHTHARSSKVDPFYNYWVDHRNALNELLLGTVYPFEPNYNDTDTTKGSRGDYGEARWSGGRDTLTPNMSFVVWRGKDIPTLAEYKESSGHPLINLGLKIGKVPQNERNTVGGYTDSFTILLGMNPNGDYYTSFQCSHGDGSTQSHSSSDKAEYNADVNILSYLGEENTGDEIPSANTNSSFKSNGVNFNNSQTGGLYGKSSGFPIRDESKKLEFHPYVQMAFDYPYDKDNIQGTKAVNVLAQHKSTIIPTDFVNVGWVRSVNPTINISSNQWLKHKRAEKYGKDATLPGGAMYQLDTKGNSSKVAVTTWQHYLAQEQQAALINDGSYFTLSNANTRHTDLVAETKESLNTLDVEQYVHPRDNVANAFEGGSKVKGKGQNMSIEGRTFKLSTFDKHHLVYNSNKNSKNVAEADIDIISENSSRTYYKVYADIDGNVYVQKSTNGSSWATLDKLPKSQNASSLGNAESIELDNKTKIVTNLINALDRNKGNDPSVGNGPQWYNEAWDGIFVVKNDTVIEVGLNEPANRVSILDPRLTPPQASQHDLYTKAYSSQFRLNTKSYSNINKPEGYIGKFGDMDIILPEMMNMHYSKKFYIPSGTVEDNIYIN